MARVLLGPVCVDREDWGSLEGKIRTFLAARTPSHIVTINALMFNHALADPGLAAVVREAALVIPDSIGIVWAVRRLYGFKVPRLTGIDLLHRLCAGAASSGHRVFLLGARPGVAEEAAKELLRRHPGLTVAGTRHGYFSAQEEAGVIASVRGARADILLAGLPVPHQEKWIASRLRELNVPVVIGVGGSFDVISGRLRRAPEIMQRLGLEWLFRLLQEPWRVARMKDLPVFVWNILKLKKGGNNGSANTGAFREDGTV